MVGANYMGGKRNTARAKSRDVVGRVQRRHFGKQRLASALCVGQGTRVRATTRIPSVLPEITFAHARRDGTESGGRTSCVDRRNSSLRSPKNTTKRKKPSKILSALDTSDHASVRAVIDRILQQPSLVGVDACDPTETPLFGRTETMVVGWSTPTPKDRNTAYLETLSKNALDSPLTYSEVSEWKRAGLCGPDLNTRHRFGEGAVLSPSSPLRDIASLNCVDDSRYVGACLPVGVDSDPFLDPVQSLPRSPPFTSSPRSSEQFEGNNRMDTAKLHFTPQPLFCVPSPGFSLHEGSTRVERAQTTISSSTNSDEEGLQAERPRAGMRWHNSLASSPTASDEHEHLFSFERGHGATQMVMKPEVVENGVPCGISIDFLSDPHPWETIGRILELEPSRPFAVRPLTAGGFTNDREGVGHISLRSPDRCNGDGTSFGARMDDDKDEDGDVLPEAHEIQGPRTFATAVGTVFTGPCLFGDSDLEDE